MKVLHVTIVLEDRYVEEVVERLSIFVDDDDVHGMEVLAYDAAANPDLYEEAEEDGFELRTIQ